MQFNRLSSGIVARASPQLAVFGISHGTILVAGRNPLNKSLLAINVKFETNFQGIFLNPVLVGHVGTTHLSKPPSCSKTSVFFFRDSISNSGSHLFILFLEGYTYLGTTKGSSIYLHQTQKNYTHNLIMSSLA